MQDPYQISNFQIQMLHDLLHFSIVLLFVLDSEKETVSDAVEQREL